MEMHDDENKEQTCKTVILILENRRFKIDRQRLMQKSHYFAALLSPNYKEHRQSEHVINYEIPLKIFKNFLHWIYHGKLKRFNYSCKNIDYILTLLELSVLFLVDELTDAVIEQIEKRYLLPNYLIDIWLLAQELGLTLLQDVCLAACLDRFTELPYQSINELSEEQFLKLVLNANLRCSYLEVENIINNWSKSKENICPKDLLDIKAKQSKKISYGIVSNGSLHITKEFYLHCWDGRQLFQLDTFRFPKGFSKILRNKVEKNAITGMQIVGRGCYLYFIGGEFSIGSGKYNKQIWRYSLITKKWFSYATLPTMRRHMIAAFIGSKLLLMGGVGRYRLKLSSIDIYDVHTGIWSQGAQMPITFTTVPEHFVFCKELIVYNTLEHIYRYCPDRNEWNTLRFMGTYNNNLPVLLPVNGSRCIIEVVKPGHEMTFLSLVNLNDENRTYFTTPDNQKYYLYTSTIQDLNKFRSLSNAFTRFFSMINPADLRN
ncbi:hypothetical protein HN011_007208 [Eciton burchellii]|nr:hypothetical protein HN011_007208 [Eciton burchellii]